MAPTPTIVARSLEPSPTPPRPRIALASVFTVVAATTALETLALDRLAAGVAACAIGPHAVGPARIATFTLQAVVCASSPLLLRIAGRTKSMDRAAAARLWAESKPLTSLPPGFLRGRQVLHWDALGKFLFAPAFLKYRWAGKTVHSASRVDMLVMGGFQMLPTPRYAFPWIGAGYLSRHEQPNAPPSLALSYRHLPVTDTLRRLDERTIIGRMTVGKRELIYFTLEHEA